MDRRVGLDLSEQGVVNGMLIAYLALGEIFDGANEGDFAPAA